jgi:signal peptidase I
MRRIGLALVIALSAACWFPGSDGAGQWLSSKYDTFWAASQSMLPGLLVGDYFYVALNPFANRAPQRWEVVVFELARDRGKPIPVDLAPDLPRDKFISRIVGLPGDEVELRGGVLYLNGVAVEETPSDEQLANREGAGLAVTGVQADGVEFSLARTTGLPERDMAPLRVAPGRLLLLSDHRNDAYDGRFFGTIPFESVIGSITFIYFSKPPDEWKIRSERIGIRPNGSLEHS